VAPAALDIWRKIAERSELSDAELVVRMLNSVVYVSRAALTPEQRIAFARHGMMQPTRLDWCSVLPRLSPWTLMCLANRSIRCTIGIISDDDGHQMYPWIVVVKP
jgi:hypothetical protein